MTQIESLYIPVAQRVWWAVPTAILQNVRSGRIGEADIEVRESLLGGVSDGSLKFVSAELYGGG